MQLLLSHLQVQTAAKPNAYSPPISKKKIHKQGLPHRRKALTAQPNAARTDRNTDSHIFSSSWAGRDRKSFMWVYRWHSPTPWIPNSPDGDPTQAISAEPLVYLGPPAAGFQDTAPPQQLEDPQSPICSHCSTGRLHPSLTLTAETHCRPAHPEAGNHIHRMENEIMQRERVMRVFE